MHYCWRNQKYTRLMFGRPLKTGNVSALSAAKTTSPAVTHELAITTADENRLAIFSRVSKATMSPLPLRW
jgi:hypothetical protein